MAVTIQGSSRRIGLALSGGGFRAAAFHLGVMRKLTSLGLLDKIDLLSCVSGGSIAGGFVALNWQDPAKLDRLDAYLRTKSIAVSSFIGGLLDPFHSRLDALAATYERDLVGTRTLGDLKQCPRTYLNTTNLATGNLCFFVGGGDKPAEIGDHELGSYEDPTFRLSHAIAASSAFPPVFPPLRLPAGGFPTAGTVEHLSLTDGGVYDNMGVNPTLRARNALDYVIVSDGGAPFANDDTPTESGALVLRAALDVLMEQVRGLQFDRLQHRHLAKVGPKPLWFSIDSTIGELNPGDAAFASRVPTNLKRLSPIEMDALGRHGGALVEARLAAYAPELLS